MSGGYNFAAVIVGEAGSGKTWLARHLVGQFLRDWPTGIVLAHDEVRQYSRHPYADAAAVRAAIAAAQTKREVLPRVLSVGGSSEDLTKLALELGERANTAQLARRPVLVVYDEGSLLSGSGSTWIGQTDQRALAIRRHRGVGSIYALQRATQLQAAFYDFSTDVYLFRGSSKTARLVEELYSLERGQLEQILRLEKHHHIHLRKGDFGGTFPTGVQSKQGG